MKEFKYNLKNYYPTKRSLAGTGVIVFFSILLTCLNFPCFAQLIPIKDTSLRSRKEPIFLFSLNGGMCTPLASYGSTAPVYNEQFSQSYSFANNGFTFGITATLNIWRGWGLIIHGAFTHQSFNASKYLDENEPIETYGMGGKRNDSVSYLPYWFNVNGDVNAIGNYCYKQYYVLLGFSKTYLKKRMSYGFRFMFGANFVYEPAIHSLNTADTVGSSLNGGKTTYYWNVDSKQYYSGTLDVGLLFRYNFTSHIFGVFNEDLILSAANNNSFNNTPNTTKAKAFDNNGNLLFDNIIYGPPAFSSFNTIVGIGYCF